MTHGGDSSPHVRFEDSDNLNVDAGRDDSATQAVDEADQVQALNINLDNFESSDFAESRYVLTSPRSLEACSKFGIKPVELLEKSLEEFQEEFPNVNKNVLIGLYQKDERDRQRRLRLVRGERDSKINRESESASTNEVDPDFVLRGSRIELTEHDSGQEASSQIKDQNQDFDFSEKLQALDLSSSDEHETPSKAKQRPSKEDEDTLNLLKRRYQEELSKLARINSSPARKTAAVKSASTSKRPQSNKAKRPDAASVMRLAEMRKQEEDVLREDAISVPSSSHHLEYAERARYREAVKRRQMEEKKLVALQRRLQVEQNRRQLSKEEERVRQLIEAQLVNKTKHAQVTKSEMERSEKLKKIVENAERELKHLENKKMLDQDINYATELKRNYVEQKHNQAHERFMKAQLRKEAEIREKARQEAIKAELAKRSSALQQQEIDRWRSSVAQRAQQDEERAVRHNRRLLQQKQSKVHADLNSKLSHHNMTKKKIDEENERMKHLLENEIVAKNQRSDVIKHEKELTNQKSKELALSLSAIKKMKSLESKSERFDEKARKAELENQVLFRPTIRY